MCTDTDVCQGASADIASVEVPQPTQCQSEFMAVLCMKSKDDVSKTAHLITQEIISVMPSVWIDVWHGAFDIFPRMLVEVSRLTFRQSRCLR